MLDRLREEVVVVETGGLVRRDGLERSGAERGND
jgi:hypothetical protein